MSTKLLSSPKLETCSEQDVQHLFKAISKGKAHLTRFMLAASGNSLMNCFNDEGRTPLMECCYIREEATRVTMVKTIRDAGADVNQKDEGGRTALIHACQQRCNDVVRILIMHWQIVPDAEDADGNTALIHSCYNGNDVAVELLVRNFRRLGLQVDHFNKDGYTALHTSAKNGFLQCAKILATKGKATLTLKDKVRNMTPLEWCLAGGYQKSEVEYLKPSVKFYKVAKLTTTMVKYRKRSSTGQENISSVASRISPVKAVDKVKQKSKSLLKKSKPQENDTGCSGNSVVHSLPKQKSSDKSNDKNPANCGEPEKQKSGMKAFIKKAGQRRSANNDNKSGGTKGTSGSNDQEGDGKELPIVRIHTTSEDDMCAINPSTIATSKSTSSSFSDKDYDQSGACGNSDMDDINTCSMATDTTVLLCDEKDSTPCTFSSTELCNDHDYTNTAFNNNNVNKYNKRGLEIQSFSDNKHTGTQEHQDTNYENDINQYLVIGEDEESLSDGTLPPMSPLTQIESIDLNYCAGESNDFDWDDSRNRGNGSKTHSEKSKMVSTSPQTDVEFLHWDDDYAASSDVLDSKPDFDDIIKGQVLKFIDEVTTSEFFEPRDKDSSKLMKESTPVNAYGKHSGYSNKSGVQNTRREINNGQVKKIEDSNSPAQRSRSCSPETIIENLDALSIPREVR